MTIAWLTLDVIQEFHDKALEDHGGLQGIRDEGRLQSLESGPQNFYMYLSREPSVAEIAAKYAIVCCQWHPFNDGNKRTAYMMMAAFLDANDVLLTADDSEIEEMIVQLANHQISDDDFMQWVLENTQPMSVA